MHTFISILLIVLSCIIGYLLGSISNGVIVGKVFCHKDIREEGSKNAGGTNAGRVLGKKFGVLVIFLDILKTLLTCWIIFFTLKYALSSYLVMDPTYYSYLGGLFCCIGHTYPLYTKFKGGKAVACFAGLVITFNYGLAIFGFTLYLIILKITKYVSLTSIITTLIVGLVSFIPFWNYTMNFTYTYDYILGIYYVLLALFVMYKHKENIIRLKNHEEKKITWMK